MAFIQRTFGPAHPASGIRAIKAGEARVYLDEETFHKIHGGYWCDLPKTHSAAGIPEGFRAWWTERGDVLLLKDIGDVEPKGCL